MHNSHARQVLTNPHITSAEQIRLPFSDLPDSLQTVERLYLEALNAEIKAENEGHDRSLMPIGGAVLRQVDLAYDNVEDDLTGLLNRKGLEVYFQRNLPEKFAIVFADARKFKAINDEHGQQFGDRVIHHLGQKFMDKFRTEDEDHPHEQRQHTEQKDAIGIARVGGDEFFAIIDLSELEDGEEQGALDSISSRLDQFGTYYDEETGEQVELSVRSNIILGRKSDEKSLDDYMKVLDPELYRQKAQEKTNS